MKFPGRRSHKHYFPVTEKSRNIDTVQNKLSKSVYIVGIDQLLVDIEISVTDEFLQKNDFPKGESFLIDDKMAQDLYQSFKSSNSILGEHPGGAVGNTLHNFAVLADTPCVALGAIKDNITVGDYAYKYLSQTSGLVDLSYLQPSSKHMGRAFCFITKDGERTFAISKGCMNELEPDYVKEEVIKKSSCLLISAYCLRDESEPIYHATLKAVDIANEFKVPVVLSLGTSHLVASCKERLKDFIRLYVNVLAMNSSEVLELFDIEDPLLSIEESLDYVDLVLLTVGDKGLYMGGHVDEQLKRKTKDPLHSKLIQNYNAYEYSRGMFKNDCLNPIKFYSHINPFQGGPNLIKNTNGAGDGALSAVLHDIAANNYHRLQCPTSPKHNYKYLTYSSISQICKYSNRVSYEILSQNSPRLFQSLPEREDGLEDSYWSQ